MYVRVRTSPAIDHIASAPAVDPNIHPKDLWFRIDHQSFRKLPRTNAIIFGV